MTQIPSRSDRIEPKEIRKRNYSGYTKQGTLKIRHEREGVYDRGALSDEPSMVSEEEYTGKGYIKKVEHKTHNSPYEVKYFNDILDKNLANELSEKTKRLNFSKARRIVKSNTNEKRIANAPKKDRQKMINLRESLLKGIADEQKKVTGKFGDPGDLSKLVVKGASRATFKLNNKIKKK